MNMTKILNMPMRPEDVAYDPATHTVSIRYDKFAALTDYIVDLLDELQQAGVALAMAELARKSTKLPKP